MKLYDSAIWRRKELLKLSIKGMLEERGKSPTESFLEAAAEFLLTADIKISYNPCREHWYIRMLCDLCDSDKLDIDGWIKNELKDKTDGSKI